MNRWTADRANEWHRSQPWLVGCNFIPSTAINQLEMWQPETFDLETIDRELGWLAAIGMNSLRVFLHDLLWSAGPQDFWGRKADVVLPLIAKAFEWARSARPSQPLTSGVWGGDWSDPEKLPPLQRFQIEASDLVSFHSYAPPQEMEERIGHLKQYGRPLLCTELIRNLTLS